MVIFGDLVEKIPAADGQLYPIHTGDMYDKVRQQNPNNIFDSKQLRADNSTSKVDRYLRC
jgi:hypothetical protein